MKQTQQNLSLNQPWWRHRWPWILAAGPLVVVVAGFITMWMAYHGADEVIHDGYVKEGKVITLKPTDTTAASKATQ